MIHGMSCTSVALPVESNSLNLTLYADRNKVFLKTIGQLLPQLTGTLQADITRCFTLYQTLDQSKRHQILGHPLFCYWWAELVRLNESASLEQRNAWLQELSRFLVVPALQNHCWRHGGLRVRLNEQGEARFPGHPWQLTLPLAGSLDDEARNVLFVLEGDILQLRHSGKSYSLKVSELLYGTPTNSLVTRRLEAPNSNIEIDASDPWISKFLNEGQRFSPALPALTPVTALNSVLASIAQQALSLIKQSWPELRTEIETNVRLIVPFSGSNLASLSHPLLQGAIFLNTLPGNWLLIAEQLVYETACLQFYNQQAVETVHCHADGEFFATPLTSTERWTADRLYRHTFACGQVVELLWRAFEATGEPIYQRRAAEWAQTFEGLLEATLRQLQLTAIGQKLLSKTKERLGALSVRY